MTAVATVQPTAPAPFLKWAGGKRQLVPELLKAIPPMRIYDPPPMRDYATYYEPFVGGGALFFALRARGWTGYAVLGDSNELLMRAYTGVRDDVDGVIGILREHRYNKREFLAVRAWDMTRSDRDDVGVAAWMIYLNKTCFNGLWRVNSQGRFNVPFGRYTNPTICDEPRLRACSEALKNTALNHSGDDFEESVRTADKGDVVYFDPPYVPVSTTADFTSYTRDGFTWADQVRLRDCALRLKAKGVHVILSNADVPAVRKLYATFSKRRVEARRAINSKADRRGAVGELIITCRKG